MHINLLRWDDGGSLKSDWDGEREERRCVFTVRVSQDFMLPWLDMTCVVFAEDWRFLLGK